MKPLRGIHNFVVFDDPERQMVTIEGSVRYTCTPGEPMVRYYKDGSGYPGSPPEVEFFDPMVMAITVSLGGKTFEIDLQNMEDDEARAMGDDAWNLADLEDETYRVLEKEAESAHDGPEE